MNKYEKIIFWLKFSLKLNDYSSCGLQQCYTTVSMKEIQSNAHQNFIVCKESMTYLNQILSECGLTCGLLCLLTTKDKCLKKVNKQGICGTAPDLTSHFYCCFFLKTCKKKKKKVPNGICYFMKISQHQKHSGTRHTWEVKLTLCQQRAVTHRCGWCRQGEESWLLTSLHFHSEGLPN